MTHATAMLDSYPADLGDVDRAALARCIDECFDCAETSTACADACLSEATVAELTKTIRTNLDCADVCDTTGRVPSRRTGYDANLTRAALQTCITACRACADAPALRSATGTPTCTSTAGSAPKPAAAASGPARNCSTPSAEPKAPMPAVRNRRRDRGFPDHPAI